MKTLAAMILTATAMVGTAGCASETSSADESEASGEDAFTATPSRHAIVLAHGFDASTTNRWSFY